MLLFLDVSINHIRILINRPRDFRLMLPWLNLQGLVMLVVASTAALRRHSALFFVALYTVSVGEGGHKPCVQTFAADQFDEDLPAEKEAKSSFFNWWYLGIVVGATLAVLVVIYVEDFVGWTVGYGMLAAATVLALAVFLAGSRTYAKEAPVGSPFTRVAHVVAAAVRKRRLSEERDGRGILYGDGGEIGGGAADDERLRTRALARTNQFRYVMAQNLLITIIHTNIN